MPAESEMKRSGQLKKISSTKSEKFVLTFLK